MTMRGHSGVAVADADYVFKVTITDGIVDVVLLKAREQEAPLAHDDPRLASLRAAFLRYIDGEAT